MNTKQLKNNLLVLLLTIISFGGQAQKNSPVSITESGKFVLGCNYWASHAGTNMWKDWRPDVVEADMKHHQSN